MKELPEVARVNLVEALVVAAAAPMARGARRFAPSGSGIEGKGLRIRFAGWRANFSHGQAQKTENSEREAAISEARAAPRETAESSYRFACSSEL